MNNKISIILGIILIIVLIIGLLSFFTLKNSKSCDQLVIDTNELISGIDIPKQTKSQCFYDEKERIRVAIYTINNTHDFISKYRFEKLNNYSDTLLWSQNSLKGNNTIKPVSANNLFQKYGEKNGNKWHCIIDRNSGKTWFEIKWKK
jgi:hypothetical protein